MKRVGFELPLAEQAAEPRAIASLPDANIDAGDIPEQRAGAERGVFFRPVEEEPTLRLDADLIAWFAARARDRGGYRAVLDSALRAYMAQHRAD